MFPCKGVTIDITSNPVGINSVGPGDSFQSLFSQIKNFKCFWIFFCGYSSWKKVFLSQGFTMFTSSNFCGNLSLGPGDSF